MDHSLYSVLNAERIDAAPRGIPLVIALEGFSDAGGAVDLLIGYMSDGESMQLLAEFSNDRFLDYRARRPTVTFMKDHLVDYEPQRLSLHLAFDELGLPFLFLSGYEPDFQWDAFVREVKRIVRAFEVTVTTWVHAIPMPVPHTRPLGSTVSGSLTDLIEASSIWQPTTQLSASIGHAIEYALYEDQRDIAGFVLLVPHYLANTQYPQALSASLRCIMDATGLLFSTAEIEERETAFVNQVDEQIRDNRESVEMIETLEARYDEFMRERETSEDDFGEPLADDEAELPTAEQIASQLEDYLAKYWGEPPTDPGGSGKSGS